MLETDNKQYTYIKKNLDDKEQAKDIPAERISVLKQKFFLIEAIKTWLAAMRKISSFKSYFSHYKYNFSLYKLSRFYRDRSPTIRSCFNRIDFKQRSTL